MNIDLLTSDGSKVIAKAVTDADGKYDFFGVTPGDYIVQVDKGKNVILIFPQKYTNKNFLSFLKHLDHNF